MSTRANIVIKSKNEENMYLYRHSDGYPEGALPILCDFMNALDEGKIRDNIHQSVGWLIVSGFYEYLQYDERENPFDFLNNDETFYSDWKVGSIEPTDGIHGDVEYIYSIDLDKKTLYIEDLREKRKYKYDYKNSEYSLLNDNFYRQNLEKSARKILGLSEETSDELTEKSQPKARLMGI